VLVVERVTKRFGALVAVHDVSFGVGRGEIVGIIGPNGAGKSTLIDVVSGFEPPSAGTVRFDGRPITGLRPSAICRRGLARTFQLAQTFASFTVFDTVLVAAGDMPELTAAWPQAVGPAISANACRTRCVMICRLASAQLIPARMAPRYFSPSGDAIGADASSRSGSTRPYPAAAVAISLRKSVPI